MGKPQVTAQAPRWRPAAAGLSRAFTGASSQQHPRARGGDGKLRGNTAVPAALPSGAFRSPGPGRTIALLGLGGTRGRGRARRPSRLRLSGGGGAVACGAAPPGGRGVSGPGGRGGRRCRGGRSAGLPPLLLRCEGASPGCCLRDRAEGPLAYGELRGEQRSAWRVL